MKQGMSKTSKNLGKGLADLLVGAKEIDDEIFEEIETQLLVADVGVEATDTIIGNLTDRVGRQELVHADALYEALQEELRNLLVPGGPAAGNRHLQKALCDSDGGRERGRQDHHHRQAGLPLQGRRQERDAGRRRHPSGPPPWSNCRCGASATAFRWSPSTPARIPPAWSTTRCRRPSPRGADVLIADTAGRLHTRGNLMEELSKVTRVMKKLSPEAPHEVLLVLDAGTGPECHQSGRGNSATPPGSPAWC